MIAAGLLTTKKSARAVSTTTMKTTNEIVTVFWRDGQMVGMLHQNGALKLFTLKPASKADVAELLESENVL